jgi:hypothetical protein
MMLKAPEGSLTAEWALTTDFYLGLLLRGQNSWHVTFELLKDIPSGHTATAADDTNQMVRTSRCSSTRAQLEQT